MSVDETFLPYGKQWLADDDIAAVTESLRGDWLTTGPTIARFEEALAAACDAPHAVAVNSGTAALHAAYAAAGLGPGDEIITTPLTFVATANAARYCGADVRFVDVRADTGNLDPRLVEAAITERTRLVVAVDYAGHPADYDALQTITDKHGLTLIADAAHSLGGAAADGRKVGTLAAMTTVSLHPVKPITTGEGGAILTADARLAERCRDFRNHGMIRERSRLSRDEGPWFYEVAEPGYNYRLTDFQSALGLSQLPKLPAFVARRRELVSRWMEELADVEELTLPTARPGVQSGWHLFVVRIRGDASRRLAFFNRLRELGIGGQVHYVPVPWHPYYRQIGCEPGSWPVAEDFYSRCVSLPLYPRLSDEEHASAVRRVKQAVRDVLT